MSTPRPTGATPVGDGEPAPSGRPAWVPIAAVVGAILLVALVGFLVTRDGGGDTALAPGPTDSASPLPAEDTVLPSEPSPVPLPPENPSPAATTPSAPASTAPEASPPPPPVPPSEAPPATQAPSATEPAPAPTSDGAGQPQPPPTIPEAPSDAEQGGAGTVTTTDGQQLLPGVPEDLSPFAGATVDGALVRVQQVVGDEAFWIGESAEDRLLVVVSTTDESAPQVTEGQAVSFRGTVERNPDDPTSAFGVEESEGLAQLQQQGHHLAASEVSLS